jgi:hypothetical protein
MISGYQNLIIENPELSCLVFFSLSIFCFILATLLKKSPREIFRYTASSLFILALLEIYFSFNWIQTDGFGFSLQTKRWFHLYWKPTNSAGYRDDNFETNSPHIVLLGDSFAAGYGIKSIEQRLDYHIESFTGIPVNNISKNGWSLKDYLHAYKKYPQHPDFTVVSYVLNDIIGAIKTPELRQDLQKILGTQPKTSHLAANSYFFSWAHWQLNHLSFNSPDKIYKTQTGLDYAHFISSLFKNPATWEEHSLQLKKIKRLSEKKNSRLLVILWPHIRDIEGSKEILSKISNELKKLEIEHIDLSAELQKIPVRERHINSRDAHPGPASHHIAGLFISKHIIDERSDQNN